MLKSLSNKVASLLQNVLEHLFWKTSANGWLSCIQIYESTSLVYLLTLEKFVRLVMCPYCCFSAYFYPLHCSLFPPFSVCFEEATYPTNIDLFKINKRYNRKKCEICSKLTIKSPERHQWRSCDFIVDFEHISHFFLFYLLLDLNK